MLISPGVPSKGLKAANCNRSYKNTFSIPSGTSRHLGHSTGKSIRLATGAQGSSASSLAGDLGQFSHYNELQFLHLIKRGRLDDLKEPCSSKVILISLFFKNFIYFGCATQHVGSSLPDHGRLPVPPCSGKAESTPLDHQGSPLISL